MSIRKTILWFALVLCAFSIYPVDFANAETRKLKLYFLHTGERAEIAYKRNGRYLPGGLKKINNFLRDWRRNEPTKMDPKLLDLVWEVYKEAGGRKHIHVISGYRSLKTNNLLRKRGRGVARKSQHSLGKALDFYIPGVKLSKLRAIGLRKGLGGVGYYPRSGSPFVHLDTGRVRHWPRMSRKELVRIFPNGKTLHVPTDGKPLPGYNIAKARYERATSGKIVVAKAEEIEKKPGLFAKLLGRGDDDSDDAVAATAPKPVKVVRAPKPAAPAAAVASQTIETAPNAITSFIPPRIPIPAEAPREIPAIETTDTLIASAEEILSDTSTASEQQVALAVPVPSQSNRTPVEDNSAALTAQAEPVQEQSANIQTAALSPTEIQDLRRQVNIAIETPVANTDTGIRGSISANTPVVQNERFGPPKLLANAQPSTGIRPPRPSQGLTGEVERLAQNSGNALFGYADAESGSDLRARIEPSAAAKQALNRQFSLNRIEQAINTKAPETSSNLTPQAIAAVAIPSTNPREKAVIAEAVGSTVRLATVPVPTQRPAFIQPAIQTASIKPESSTRELSDEQIKSANLDERLSGNWALATTARISEIAEISPPAYGKNALRERPNRVLSSGFSQQRIESFTRGFTGSSVEFLNFKRFD